MRCYGSRMSFIADTIVKLSLEIIRYNNDNVCWTAETSQTRQQIVIYAESKIKTIKWSKAYLLSFLCTKQNTHSVPEYTLYLELGGPLHSVAPRLCLPCLPYRYATDSDRCQILILSILLTLTLIITSTLILILALTLTPTF